MTWLQQNYQGILAALGALYTLLSVINGLIKNPEANGFLEKVLDGISFITRQGAEGSVKRPFSYSRRLGSLAPPSSTPPSAVALLLVPLLMFSACAFGQCLLGKLKASEQPLLVDVTTDLASADYFTLLGQLAASVGDDLVTCTVQAVENYEAGKQKSADGGTALAATEPSVVLTHAQAWLASHKKVACESRNAS
jgi:hypothetical protein